jgi:hypothetical protein
MIIWKDMLKLQKYPFKVFAPLNYTFALKPYTLNPMETSFHMAKVIWFPYGWINPRHPKPHQKKWTTPFENETSSEMKSTSLCQNEISVVGKRSLYKDFNLVSKLRLNTSIKTFTNLLIVFFLLLFKKLLQHVFLSNNIIFIKIIITIMCVCVCFFFPWLPCCHFQYWSPIYMPELK